MKFNILKKASVLGAVAIMAVSIAGCGGKKEQAPAPAPAETEAPAPVETEAPKNTTDATDATDATLKAEDTNK